MSEFKHTLAVVVSILLAYLWLATPSLSYYSLQAFALATFGFFISKRFSNAQIWHILPKAHSFEIVFISFAVVILIGSTGNSHSIFYPFAYIHLFFLVMTTRQSTAIVATITTLLIHYALEPNINANAIASLTTLPLILVFFLFARKQYDEARMQQKIAQAEEKEIMQITRKEHSLESFITEFLQPKLAVLRDILQNKNMQNEAIDPRIIETQLDLLESESQKIIENNNKKE